MNLRKDFWLVMTLLSAFPAIILSMIAGLLFLREVGTAERPNRSQGAPARIVLVTPRSGIAGAGVFGAIAGLCYWRYSRQLKVER